jgi:chromosomal replication initiator protein
VPSHSQLESTWAAFRDRLRSEIPDDLYRVWLEPLRAIALTDGILYVQAPAQTREWIRRRFGTALSRALASLDESLQRVEIVSETGALEPVPFGEGPVSRRGVNKTHRFEDFVIGSSNRFGHAAALAAAELPGQAYNPLFLYGTAGVGKTHLLHAIANYTLANDDDLNVVYATGETFTGDFTSALRAGEMDVFKKRYRQADVLLLDDVQFVESKPRTADELLHTFDVLLDSGAQLAFVADRAPAAMSGLDSRLRDRFDSGLVVDIQPPDFETRLSIVRKRAGRWLATKEQHAAIELLARQVSSSIHALEGALVRVRAYASLTQQPLTTALVQHVLDSLYTPAPSNDPLDRPSVDRIQDATSTALKLPPAELTSAKRARRVVYARQVAMYLCRELTDLSLPAIGQRFGGRDHTTVLHAHRQVRKRMIIDESTREVVEDILARLNASADPA